MTSPASTSGRHFFEVRKPADNAASDGFGSNFNGTAFCLAPNQLVGFLFSTDTITLLSVLRTAKFSQLRAREMIENSTKLIAENKRWMTNIDSCDPKIHAVLDTGSVCILASMCI